MSLALNVGSEDAQTLIEYYRRLFGDPLMEMGGYATWQLGDSLFTVGPHTDVKGKNPYPGRVMWSIMSQDAKADFERYKAAGAIVVRELYQDKDAPQFSIATFADPDDNYFQIVTRT